MPWTLVILTLAVWVGAISILVAANLTDQRLWLPVILALAGVFSSILPLAITPNVALVANEGFLVLFAASVVALKLKHRIYIAPVRHRIR